MNEDFVQERIAQLRLQRGVSARDMSLSIGQNSSYINRIENKKTVPSLQALFDICEYFDMTPAEFFDEENKYPETLNGLIADLKRLDETALSHIAGIAKELVHHK